MKIKISMLFAAIGLLGCSPQIDTPMNVQSPTEITAGLRIQVTRIGVFEDTLAYGDRRGIYLIKDTLTETEYVGISGIGISELGSHSEKHGKTTVTIQDER